MSSADIPDDPVDHRVDARETRAERFDEFVDAAVEAEMASGRREETLEQAKRSLHVRIGIIVGGLLVTILGLAMLVLPGPGLIVVAAGLGLLALEVPFAARLLDKVKDRLPQDDDGKIPRKTIVMMVVTTVVFVSATTGGSIWWSFFRE